MTPGIAFVNSSPVDAAASGPALTHFNDGVVLRLQLSAGVYVVIGRVVIRNFDDDAQPASAKITLRDGADVVDRVQLPTLAGGTEDTVALQGTLKVADGEIVDLRCATFQGTAGNASLCAIQVSRLLAGPGKVIA